MEINKGKFDQIIFYGDLLGKRNQSCTHYYQYDNKIADKICQLANELAFSKNGIKNERYRFNEYPNSKQSFFWSYINDNEYIDNIIKELKDIYYKLPGDPKDTINANPHQTTAFTLMLMGFNPSYFKIGIFYYVPEALEYAINKGYKLCNDINGYNIKKLLGDIITYIFSIRSGVIISVSLILDFLSTCIHNVNDKVRIESNARCYDEDLINILNEELNHITSSINTINYDLKRKIYHINEVRTQHETLINNPPNQRDQKYQDDEDDQEYEQDVENYQDNLTDLEIKIDDLNMHIQETENAIQNLNNLMTAIKIIIHSINIRCNIKNIHEELGYLPVNSSFPGMISMREKSLKHGTKNYYNIINDLTMSSPNNYISKIAEELGLLGRLPKNKQQAISYLKDYSSQL